MVGSRRPAGAFLSKTCTGALKLTTVLILKPKVSLAYTVHANVVFHANSLASSSIKRAHGRPREIEMMWGEVPMRNDKAGVELARRPRGGPLTPDAKTRMKEAG